jgi:hypothetical protein
MTGFEPLIGAATAGLAGLISNVIKEKGGDLLKEQILTWDAGGPFTKRFKTMCGAMPDRHGTLKVACVRMDSPIKLDEIYTAVQLVTAIGPALLRIHRIAPGVVSRKRQAWF